MPRSRLASVALLALLLAVVASGCTKDVNSGFDSLACVYDGSDEGGERLLKQLPPGNHTKTDLANIVVKIPTSNRFYAASQDRGVADPGAPDGYIGFARGNARVLTAGQVRFRFNPSRSCAWYAHHGRRNAQDGELGFNSRGDETTGWARWLNENFGVTMQDVVSSVTNKYTWPSLVYNYPSNANPDTGFLGKDKKAEEPIRLVYGRELGAVFTERLNANLGEGGPFFCGIDTEKTGDPCPPMTFQVFNVTTVDPTLTAQREAIEKSNQQLANAQADADARARTQKTAIYAERLKQKLLPLQVKNAILQAQIDNAKCIAFARVGLDCNGKRPDLVLGGGR